VMMLKIIVVVLLVSCPGRTSPVWLRRYQPYIRSAGPILSRNAFMPRYLYPVFGNSATGQTRRRVFAFNCPNDADSRKGVLFGIYSTSFWGSNRPDNPMRIRVFKPNAPNIETFIL